MRFRARLVVSPSSEASSQRQGDGQRFQKKSYENHKANNRSGSPGECPASGCKNKHRTATSLCHAHRPPRIAHLESLGTVKSATAAAIRTGRNCWPVDLAGLSSQQPPRRREHALAFGLSLESTPLSVAAPVRRNRALQHPFRRPAQQIRFPFGHKFQSCLKRRTHHECHRHFSRI